MHATVYLGPPSSRTGFGLFGRLLPVVVGMCLVSPLSYGDDQGGGATPSIGPPARNLEQEQPSPSDIEVGPTVEPVEAPPAVTCRRRCGLFRRFFQRRRRCRARYGLFRRFAGRRRTCRPRACAAGAPTVPEVDAPAPKPVEKVLFDGKTLDGWKVTKFGGEGEVGVENGSLILDMGFSLTGVTYPGKLPKIDYEVSLEAMRVDGIDFFCALTFPVADSYCTLIVGGWAGGVVGLSNLDDRDASENETTKFKLFKTGRWYRIRVRVTKKKIEAWIDDEKMVDVATKGRKISIRPEMDLSRPLGIASFETKAALRNIRIRLLDDAAGTGN